MPLLLTPNRSKAGSTGAGPDQNGASRETGLPDKVDPKNPLWVADFPGQSTPVIANGKLFIMGYLGEGPDLQEGVACFDAETGQKLWQHLFNDFISDTIYLRYATASPAIDPETGNVFIQGTQGILAGFTPDGKPLWKRSLMEEFGRLTFPNARTASPVIDGDLVITRGITANWGAQGPAADRFYAFDKKSGELVWSASPSDRPKDNSFSHPYVTTRGGKRVLYSALGDGSVAAINARTGEALWRIPLFRAGINATVIVHNHDKLIAIFGVPYEPGQLVALKIPEVAPHKSPLDRWCSNARSFSFGRRTSRPRPVRPSSSGDTVYVVAEKGDLCAVNANTGEIKWKLKIGIEQRNSCPLYADGKLYVPMLDDPAGKGSGESAEAGSTGAFYIIKPGEKDAETLAHVALDGRCFGTPVAYNGKVYMQTTKHLYCWGKPGNNPSRPKATVAEQTPAASSAKSLQIIPSEVTLRPGQTASFHARSMDANGFVVEEVTDMKSLTWTSYIPPTARVKSLMNGKFNPDGPARRRCRHETFRRRVRSHARGLERLHSRTRASRTCR